MKNLKMLYLIVVLTSPHTLFSAEPSSSSESSTAANILDVLRMGAPHVPLSQYPLLMNEMFELLNLTSKDEQEIIRQLFAEEE